MNKKGVPMIKMIIFLVGSLLIGALVIAAFASIVPRLMNNLEEKIASKDIALTIMTLSASPNDIFYRYGKNVENYEIRINQEEVQVKSSEGSGKSKYLPMKGVVVADALISNALLIPMKLSGGKLSFKDEQIDYSDVCAVIPANYEKNMIKIKLLVNYEEQSDSRQKLEEIISVIKMYSTQSGSRIEFVDSDEDVILMFGTGTGPMVSYYENLENQNYVWYHKIACYSVSKLNLEKNLNDFIGSATLSPSSDKSVKINFGDKAKFLESLKNDAQLSGRISKSIYDSLELGISN